MVRSIRNCTVVVVGGAGFLGSHLVDHLIDDRNCRVIVIDNLVSGRREFIHKKALFIHHDITGSEEFLRKVFLREGVSFVFNYAAQPYIPVSFERPLHVFDINAMAALKVINASQEAGVQGILQVSSAEIYGDGSQSYKIKDDTMGGFTREDNYQINESCPVAPHSSYGAAKAAIDAIVQVRWREAQTPVIALRQFNCYGPRETHPYVIPEIISQIWLDDERAEDPIQVKLGNNSFRDFQYVGDAVRMSVELLEKGQFGEVYNLGSEKGIRIYELAVMIGELIFPTASIEIIVDETRKRPWEIWHLQSDNSKLYSVIETRPQMSFVDGLTATINDFYSNYHKWVWE